MALKIARTTPFGVAATYWHIMGANIDWVPTGVLIVRLAGYADKSARTEKKQPLAVEQLVFTGDPKPEPAPGEEAPPANMSGIPGMQTAGPFLPEPTRAEVYAAIKALPDWATAEDA